MSVQGKVRFGDHLYGYLTLTEQTCHRLRDLNKKIDFIIELEAGKSKIRVPAVSASGKDPLRGLLMATLFLHGFSSKRAWRGTRREGGKRKSEKGRRR